jgi:microcystin-dependent protein
MVQEYLGAIKIFAGSYAIRGCAFCQGQLMSLQQNTALFSLLGTTYGGDGIRTFGLPNLQSSLPIGWGNGQGLTPRVIGETGGTDNVTLLSSNIPTHNHVFNASTNPASTVTAGPSVMLGALNSGDGVFYVPSGASGIKMEPMNLQAVSTVGGSTPHNNVQPSMGINYLIALSGVFPSRG